MLQPHGSAGSQLRWPLQHQVTICATFPFPSLPFRSPTPLKTGTCFPTWCWEHLRVRLLQQLHGELGVISAELEYKATTRKAQCPCRGGTLQGKFLLCCWWKPIPRELVGLWASPRPPGLVRHQDP